jgi:homoserine trans-succinylase
MNTHTSHTMRFNITLPVQLGKRVKASRNHSALIAESLQEKFARDDKARLNVLLKQAYADAADEDKQLNRDWDVTAGDGL